MMQCQIEVQEKEYIYIYNSRVTFSILTFFFIQNVYGYIYKCVYIIYPESGNFSYTLRFLFPLSVLRFYANIYMSFCFTFKELTRTSYALLLYGKEKEKSAKVFFLNLMIIIDIKCKKKENGKSK